MVDDITKMLADVLKDAVTLMHAEEALAVDKARSVTIVSECMEAMDREIRELKRAIKERDALEREISSSSRQIRDNVEQLRARSASLIYEPDAVERLHDWDGAIRAHFVRIEATRRRINEVTIKYEHILGALNAEPPVTKH
jgi:septal ring factor EnvC (AmiA/AmiB activator)